MLYILCMLYIRFSICLSVFKKTLAHNDNGTFYSFLFFIFATLVSDSEKPNPEQIHFQKSERNIVFDLEKSLIHPGRKRSGS